MKTSLSLAVVLLAIVLTQACSLSPMKSDDAEVSLPEPTPEPSPMPEPSIEQPPEPSTSEATEEVMPTVETAIDIQKICMLDQDIRRIENINTLEGGCQLDYEKMGKVKTVATAHKGSEFCQKVLERIQANLEKGGFVCE